MITDITSQGPQPGPTDSWDQITEEGPVLCRMSGCIPSTVLFMSATGSRETLKSVSGAGEMTGGQKCRLCEHEGPSLAPRLTW